MQVHCQYSIIELNFEFYSLLMENKDFSRTQANEFLLVCLFVLGIVTGK